MAVLSPFGTALRKLRLSQDLTQFDLAQNLEVSTAFYSAIECGTKPPPPRILDQLGRIFNLRPSQLEELKDLASSSMREVKINLGPLSPDRQKLAAGLARHFDELSQEELDKIREMLQRLNPPESI